MTSQKKGESMAMEVDVHYLYSTRNYDKFASLAGRRKSSRSSSLKADVNRLDDMGRTLLHRIASERNMPLQRQLAWMEACMQVPGLEINKKDIESGYTALHRALYNGNIHLARCLMTSSDISLVVPDREGLTAFELYNVLISVTLRPEKLALYTWGNDTYEAFGVGKERAVPGKASMSDPGSPWDPLYVTDLSTSRYHTIALTNESSDNIRVSGINGTRGRLGLDYSQNPFSSNTHFVRTPGWPEGISVKQVAVSSEHSVILTNDGYVYTCGSNVHGALGYQLTGTAKKPSATVQLIPRPVKGPLKNIIIKGVACSSIHTVAYTTDGGIFTWGTNNGQLGLTLTENSLQLVPHRIGSGPLVTADVKQAACSPKASAFLLENNEVYVICGGGCHRLTPHFDLKGSWASTEALSRAALNVLSRTHIVKITVCDLLIYAISDRGHLYAMDIRCYFEKTDRSQGQSFDNFSESAGRSLESSSFRASPGFDAESSPLSDLKAARKKRPVSYVLWRPRSLGSAVIDVATPERGSLVLCTSGGHVFERLSKIGDSSVRSFSFRRVPNMQRAVRVFANEYGGFAALRSSALSPIHEEEMQTPNFSSQLPFARSIAEKLVEFHTSRPCHHEHYFTQQEYACGTLTESMIRNGFTNPLSPDLSLPFTSVELVSSILHLFSTSMESFLLLYATDAWDSSFTNPSYGADMVLSNGTQDVPCHSFIMRSRCRRFSPNRWVLPNQPSLRAILHAVYCVYADKPGFILETELGYGQASASSRDNMGAAITLHGSSGAQVSIPQALVPRCPFLALLPSGQGMVHFPYGQEELNLLADFLQNEALDSKTLFSVRPLAWDRWRHLFESCLTMSEELMLDSLKAKCEAALSCTITNKTCSHILRLALALPSLSLVKSCATFICTSLTTLLEMHALADLDLYEITCLIEKCRAMQRRNDHVQKDFLFNKYADWIDSEDWPEPCDKSKIWARLYRSPYNDGLPKFPPKAKSPQIQVADQTIPFAMDDFDLGDHAPQDPSASTTGDFHSDKLQPVGAPPKKGRPALSVSSAREPTKPVPAEHPKAPLDRASRSFSWKKSPDTSLSPTPQTAFSDNFPSLHETTSALKAPRPQHVPTQSTQSVRKKSQRVPLDAFHQKPNKPSGKAWESQKSVSEHIQSAPAQYQVGWSVKASGKRTTPWKLPQQQKASTEPSMLSVLRGQNESSSARAEATSDTDFPETTEDEFLAWFEAESRRTIAREEREAEERERLQEQEFLSWWNEESLRIQRGQT